ncbi:thymidylate synthase, partial [Candidatus Desantisbacteria bacterium]|nr:thymidylate synthase [Candidatus Desantisbacteria bacterium]
MNCEFIEARDLPDAWFQAITRILDKGVIYTITRGSYEGQKRSELDYVTVHIRYPGTRPLIPEIPAHLGIPAPVSMDYIDDYLPYLMTDIKKENEQ